MLTPEQDWNALSYEGKITCLKFANVSTWVGGGYASMEWSQLPSTLQRTLTLLRTPFAQAKGE